MKNAKTFFWFEYILLSIVFFGCNFVPKKISTENIPEFNADSAYSYIEKQVSFGSRVPNTEAHEKCALFLQKKMESFGAEVVVQNAEVERYDGEILKIKNIIAQFQPEKKDRILLFAHWDSRNIADYALDSLQNIPVLGANDGGSGVGVLMEIGRLIGKNPTETGIDIIFFDAEDQGEPFATEIYNEKSWCLGTQYWCKNPHKENYTAKFGISLDMVGAKDAKFAKEDNSRHFLGYLTKKTWKTARQLGYSEFFVSELQKGILHDHVFVSQEAGIRSMLIVEYHKGNKRGFNDTWHTHNDNMQDIDNKTLKAVGQTVLTVIFNQ